MATLRNKTELAAVIRDSLEEHSWKNLCRDSSVSNVNEEFITQDFDKIEGEFIKKISLEFKRTDSQMLGALYKPSEFFLNPQIKVYSGTVTEFPGTLTVKTRNVTRTVTRMILILK